jgi:hypothetical protein
MQVTDRKSAKRLRDNIKLAFKDTRWKRGLDTFGSGQEQVLVFHAHDRGVLGLI